MEVSGTWRHAGALAANILAGAAEARGMGKVAEAFAPAEFREKTPKEGTHAGRRSSHRQRQRTADAAELDMAAHGSTASMSATDSGSRRPLNALCASSIRTSGAPAIGATIHASLARAGF